MGLLGALVFSSTSAATTGPRVETLQGPVHGTDDGTVSRFLGIPYAAPPTGSLRFAPPELPAFHADVLPATAYGPACPQTAAFGTPSTNEDCLTLNVFRPDEPGAAVRPILVFLYGGSFKYGTAAPGPAPGGPNYDGGDIARRTGAIVVTLNYRLGVLGFLASPMLDKDDPRHVSGNYGLLDQQAALRWIRANAGAFNGDPDRITLFGQSAGALSIIEQMVSPAARGSFQAAELESPGALPSENLTTAETHDAAILSETGCATAADPAACLRAAPVSALLSSDVPIGPNVDGVVIPTAPDHALAAGTFAPVPIVLLTDRDEGTYFIAAGVQKLGHALTSTEFALTLEEAFGKTAATAIEAQYPLADGATPSRIMAAVLTDEFFSCPATTLRAALARRVPVLQAEFAQPDPVHDYPIPIVPSINPGDAHTSELAYVFGHDGSGEPLPSGSGRALSNAMIDGLGAFANAAGARLPPGDALPLGSVLSLSTPIGFSSTFSAAHHCAFWNASGIAPKLFQALK